MTSLRFLLYYLNGQVKPFPDLAVCLSVFLTLLSCLPPLHFLTPPLLLAPAFTRIRGSPKFLVLSSKSQTERYKHTPRCLGRGGRPKDMLHSLALWCMWGSPLAQQCGSHVVSSASQWESCFHFAGSFPTNPILRKLGPVLFFFSTVTSRGNSDNSLAAPPALYFSLYFFIK